MNREILADLAGFVIKEDREVLLYIKRTTYGLSIVMKYIENETDIEQELEVDLTADESRALKIWI